MLATVTVCRQCGQPGKQIINDSNVCLDCVTAPPAECPACNGEKRVKALAKPTRAGKWHTVEKMCQRCGGRGSV